LPSDAGNDSIAAIIVAAGRSERMGAHDKLWTALADRDGAERPLVAYALATFQTCNVVSRIALVVAQDKIGPAEALVEQEQLDRVTAIVVGGERRRDSVRAGIDALGPCDYVVVHDGARPLVTHLLIEDALAAALDTGASCCATPVPDTVKETSDGAIVRTVDRSTLMLAQTPQAFRYDVLLKAHDTGAADATDDASLVEALGVSVRIAPGSPRNIKVTTVEDLALARGLLGAR
jgi:2-C-methyl-D-erythritol 4-phosphate cytidylyltransferase